MIRERQTQAAVARFEISQITAMSSMETLRDHEAGYGSLKTGADPLKPAEHKKSWRRVGLAVAVLSAVALGSVAAIKTTSARRGSQPTAYSLFSAYDNVSIKSHISDTVKVIVSYDKFCTRSNDKFEIAPEGTWTAPSRGAFGRCRVTGLSGTIRATNGGKQDGKEYETERKWYMDGSSDSKWGVYYDLKKDGKYRFTSE